MPDILREPAVFGGQIVWISRKRSYAIRVAVCFCQHVIGVKRDVAIQIAIEVKNELILIEASARVVLVNIAVGRRIDRGRDEIRAVQRTHTATGHTGNESSGQWSIER